MSDETPISHDDDGIEILPPAQTLPVSAELDPSPAFGGALAEFRDRLHDALAIPPEAYLPGREVVLEVKIALVPTFVKATIRNSSNR